MLLHLGPTMRELRIQAGIEVPEAAHRAGIHPSTLYRFEAAEAWPRNPDVIVSVYARMLRRTPRGLWVAALMSWPAESR